MAEPSRPAGWYDDPEIPGVRRYWDGQGWTDSRVTTDGIRYEAPPNAPPVGPTESSGRSGSVGCLKPLVVAVIVVLLLIEFLPAFQGWHIGFTALTDRCSMTRFGIQWGTTDPSKC